MSWQICKHGKFEIDNLTFFSPFSVLLLQFLPFGLCKTKLFVRKKNENLCLTFSETDLSLWNNSCFFPQEALHGNHKIKWQNYT